MWVPSVSDPFSFYTDPSAEKNLNADPDPAFLLQLLSCYKLLSGKYFRMK